MAPACPLALTFFSCILLFQTICCSGAFVELSYDSGQVKTVSSSVVAEYRIMVTDKQRAYLFLKPFVCREKPCRSEPLAAAAGSFVKEVLGPNPNRRLNVSNIVITSTDTQLGALRRTLQSFHASLGAAGLAERVKVSPELSLSSLRIVARDRDRSRKKRWGKVMEFVRRTGSVLLVQVETEVEADSEVAVDAEIEEAAAEAAALLGAGARVVLLIKSRAAPSTVAMATLRGDTGREKRLLGVLVGVSSPSPRRELGEARSTAHDEFSPVSNPATTPVSNPVTVPATNPVANPMAPGFVTVPSTNPNLPPLYPEPTTPVTMPMPDPTTTTMPPVTVPSPFTNPVSAPTTVPGTVTNPAAPAVTNPATTPSQFPGTSPVTNPVTTYPGGGSGGGGMPATQPVYLPPATTMPGTGTVQPGAPTVAGQAWCVAKSGLMDTTLQDAIDYACGIGGADCSPIQPMGTCYNPNTLQAHASYAFNSYFQRNPSAASCDFGGAGMLVNVNPSSGTCMYQTSAGFGAGYSTGTTVGGVPSGYTPGMSGTGYNPAGGMSGTMGGGGSGSTVLNANNPGGGNSMYGGYDSTTGLTAGSAPLSPHGGWVVLCLVWIVTFAFVRDKV